MKSIRPNEPRAWGARRKQRPHAISLFVAFVLLQAGWIPHSSLSQDKKPETPVDPKIAKEVLAMEEKFILALEKRDAEALAKILADDFVDGYEGSDRALSKQGAISITKGEGLSIYRIEKDQHLSRSGANILVAGLVRENRSMVTDLETEVHWGRVQRVWTQKEGRWQLVGQVRPARDERESKEK
jgi:hypothetical protein